MSRRKRDIYDDMPKVNSKFYCLDDFSDVELDDLICYDVPQNTKEDESRNDEDNQ